MEGSKQEWPQLYALASTGKENELFLPLRFSLLEAPVGKEWMHMLSGK